jgi:UDP-N-acetyl-D-galactosamine dehydrogenase
MIKKGITINNADILLLGITFKENCPDVRNTKIVDVIKALNEYHVNITIYDPWANPADVLHEYNLVTTDKLPSGKYDSVVLGVSHKEFLELDLEKVRKENSVLYDVKGVLKINVDGNL